MRKTSVVVAIFAHKEHLSENEALSLKQCVSVLGEHPIWLIVPFELDIKVYQQEVPNILVRRFPACHFDGIKSYNRFKISNFLYDSLGGYEFLLTYELDSFVFRDELRLWMGQGYDYIGAPWFEGFSEADISAPPIGVGNSGFSLRRISACRTVVRRLELLKWIRNSASKWGNRSTTLFIDRVLSKVFGSDLSKVVAGDHIQEDLFWSTEASRLSKNFKIPSYEIARKFSFEVNPRRMFNEIGGLPFGCHAWARYDYEFWKNHIHNR